MSYEGFLSAALEVADRHRQTLFVIKTNKVKLKLNYDAMAQCTAGIMTIVFTKV